MNEYQHIIEILALSMGAAWASGINLYAVLLVLGIGGTTGYVTLPEDLQVLQDPLIIGAAGLMYMVEFVADKTPGVDSVWDSIHTAIRLPAGAMLAAASVGDVEPALEIAAAITGGGLAATSHTIKSGSRLLINTSPEPFSNWGASAAEDVGVFAGLWLAISQPLIFLALLLIFIVIAIWVIPKLWRLIRKIFLKLRAWLSGKSPEEEPLVLTETDFSTSKLEENQSGRELN